MFRFEADFNCLESDGDSAKDECNRHRVDLPDEFFAAAECARQTHANQDQRAGERHQNRRSTAQQHEDVWRRSRRGDHSESLGLECPPVAAVAAASIGRSRVAVQWLTGNFFTGDFLLPPRGGAGAVKDAFESGCGNPSPRQK